MKLKTKLFHVVNSKGVEINVKRSDVVLSHNGQRLETRLKDVCSDLEFDLGEIYGNSLLSYYNVADDGSLQVEGSKIELFDALNNEPVLIKKITRPTIHDDTDIPFEHVQKFAEYFTISKPDEVFHNLTEEEKQVFISERTGKEQASQKLQQENIENERLQKQNAEAELKASIHPDYIQDKNSYLASQGAHLKLG